MEKRKHLLPRIVSRGDNIYLIEIKNVTLLFYHIFLILSIKLENVFKRKIWEAVYGCTVCKNVEKNKKVRPTKERTEKVIPSLLSHNFISFSPLGIRKKRNTFYIRYQKNIVV